MVVMLPHEIINNTVRYGGLISGLSQEIIKKKMTTYNKRAQLFF